ncbi:hypothetical protein HDV00_009669 [Rhizophlyctis rosea]|nr:hypothetical protein HDV00_009669 [Rhizophlyctis rosea]
MSTPAARTTRLQIQPFPPPLSTSSVAYLPTELWTTIISLILLPDLRTRTTTNVLPLLLLSKTFKAVVTSTQEFQYLRNARLRMRNTVFTSAHKLFRVGEGDYQVHGNYIAILSGGEDIAAYTSEPGFASLRRSGLRDLRDGWIWNFPQELNKDDISPEQLMQAAKEYIAKMNSAVAKQKADESALASLSLDSHTLTEVYQLESSLAFLEALERTSTRIQSSLPILQALPALPKSQTTVVVCSFAHDSTCGTDDAINYKAVTWDEKAGEEYGINFLGSAEYMYWLCQEGRDLKIPQRRVSDDDYDAKERAIIYEKFIEWYEKGRLKETRLWVD